MKRETYLYFLLAVTIFIWGNSFVAAKFAIDDGASPIWIAMARFLVASAIFGAYLLIKRPPLPARSDLRTFSLLAFVGVGVYYVFQYYGVQLSGPSVQSILVTLLSPIVIFGMSFFRLNERLTAFQVAGVVVAAVGAFLVITNGRLAVIENWEALVGGSFGVICAILWAVYTVEGKRVVMKYDPMTATAYISLLGTVMIVPFAVADTVVTGPPKVPLSMILAALYLGVLCTCLGYVFWYRALTGLSASSTGSTLYAEPVVTIVFAWLLLNQAIGWTAAIGGVLVLVGVLIVSRRRLRKPLI